MKKLLFAPTVATAIALIVGMSACADDVGTACDICKVDVDGKEDCTLTDIYTPTSRVCQSRLCVRTTANNMPHGMCTRFCKSDDDCPSGVDQDYLDCIKKPGADPTKCKRSQPCTQGFSCNVYKITGQISCCKMCVCKDYFTKDETNEEYCQNLKAQGIDPVCPE